MCLTSLRRKHVKSKIDFINQYEHRVRKDTLPLHQQTNTQIRYELQRRRLLRRRNLQRIQRLLRSGR